MYICLYCGLDIEHRGLPPRDCCWHWYVHWIALWYRIGQCHMYYNRF